MAYYIRFESQFKKQTNQRYSSNIFYIRLDIVFKTQAGGAVTIDIPRDSFLQSPEWGESDSEQYIPLQNDFCYVYTRYLGSNILLFAGYVFKRPEFSTDTQLYTFSINGLEYLNINKSANIIPKDNIRSSTNNLDLFTSFLNAQYRNTDEVNYSLTIANTTLRARLLQKNQGLDYYSNSTLGDLRSQFLHKHDLYLSTAYSQSNKQIIIDYLLDENISDKDTYIDLNIKNNTIISVEYQQLQSRSTPMCLQYHYDTVYNNQPLSIISSPFFNLAGEEGYYELKNPDFDISTLIALEDWDIFENLLRTATSKAVLNNSINLIKDALDRLAFMKVAKDAYRGSILSVKIASDLIVSSDMLNANGLAKYNQLPLVYKPGLKINVTLDDFGIINNTMIILNVSHTSDSNGNIIILELINDINFNSNANLFKLDNALKTIAPEFPVDTLSIDLSTEDLLKSYLQKRDHAISKIFKDIRQNPYKTEYRGQISLLKPFQSFSKNNYYSLI